MIVAYTGYILMSLINSFYCNECILIVFLGPTILVLIKFLLNFTVFFRGTIFQSVRYRQKRKYRMWRTNGWTPDVDKGHACAEIEVPV